MAQDRAEIEAKFYVSNLEPIRKRILKLNARKLSERHLERNWRFDQPGGELTATGTVLRLRSIPPIADPTASAPIQQKLSPTLTVKQKGDQPELREEIEFEISDPDAAVDFLEALGYHVVSMYEKYREYFAIDTCELMLDELPFGQFVEIEGPSLVAIRGTAEDLGLQWERRVASSYLEIFDHLKSSLHLPFDEATFDNFSHIATLEPGSMSLTAANSDDAP